MPSTFFVSEFICGGALAGEDLPPSLAAEGGAMLAAAVADLSALPGAEVTVILDRRLYEASSEHAGLAERLHEVARVIDVSDPRDEIAWFHRLAGECEATLVIAPEFDQLLFERSRWVEQAGGRLLGSSSEAVAVASDKDHTNRLLADGGLTVTRGVCLTMPLREITSSCLDAVSFPAVLKPRFGAGSQNTYLIRQACEAPGIFEQAGREGIGEHALLESYVPGQPASVAVLVGEQGSVPLPVCRQTLSDDGRFRYLGGSVPYKGPLGRQAQETAMNAVVCLRGLRGYVGVDVVLQEDGAGVTVVEINPRLTTSYVGLRVALRSNLMAAVYTSDFREICSVETIRAVRFTPDGKTFRE